MQLMPSGRLVAATWIERTDPDGYYAGVTFQGVAQFILAEDGLSMSGAWAGHSRDMNTVNTVDAHLRRALAGRPAAGRAGAGRERCIQDRDAAVRQTAPGGRVERRR